MAAVEQKKQYAVVKDFKGVNTKNNRTVIENGEFGWLENAMPIGFGNLRIIEGNEVVEATAFTANVTYMGSVNIQNNEYVLGFQDDGSAQFVNLDGKHQRKHCGSRHVFKCRRNDYAVEERTRSHH
jgi:hypothetical protein